MNETNINQGLTNGSSYIEQIIETVQVFFGSMNNVPEGGDNEDKEDKEDKKDKEDKEDKEDIFNEENDW